MSPAKQPGIDASGSTGLLIITSGRLFYLWPTCLSLRWALRERVANVCLVNTADQELPGRLLATAARLGARTIHLHIPGGGLRTAVEQGWEALEAAGTTHVLHVEEDFVFAKHLDLVDLTVALRPPATSQALLVRQRWYRKEHQHPSQRDFLKANFPLCSPGSDLDDAGVVRVATFSFNPSLYALASIRDVAAGVSLDDPADFELAISAAATGRGLCASVAVATDRCPDVIHIGVVGTVLHRRISRHPKAVRVALYVAHHVRHGLRSVGYRVGTSQR